MTLAEIARYRLINQQLADTKIKSAVEMVEWFGAMQGRNTLKQSGDLAYGCPTLQTMILKTPDKNQSKLFDQAIQRFSEFAV